MNGTQITIYVIRRCPRFCRISMTENGNSLENAIAERVNGIIKEEYLNYYQSNNLPQAKQQLHKAINLYNNGKATHEHRQSNSKQIT